MLSSCSTRPLFGVIFPFLGFSQKQSGMGTSCCWCALPHVYLVWEALLGAVADRHQCPITWPVPCSLQCWAAARSFFTLEQQTPSLLVSCYYFYINWMFLWIYRMSQHVQLVSFQPSAILQSCISCVNMAALKSNGNSAFPLFFVGWVEVVCLFFCIEYEELI